MRNCMRMIFFFLFRVVHRNQLGKKKTNPSRNKAAVPVHVMTVVLLRFGQVESIYRKMLFPIALNSSEGCTAPACTGASDQTEETSQERFCFPSNTKKMI